ncbi:MAG: transcriptional regulator [Alphaproteobacteria bacterium]|nr:transcriptional regulator [Alphaproteobacteria bacterium]
MDKTSADRLLYLLKSKGAQTAGEIGDALGITAPGAQQNLAKLASSGLVSHGDRKQARGRPKRYWSLTEKGHGRFPDRHSDLTVELLKSTEEVFGPKGLEKLIRHREKEALAAYRAEVAGCATLRERVETLADIRSKEGYMAEWSETAPNRFVLVENHCPICAAAKMCQGLCRSELEIFRAVLGPNTEVERTDHVIAGARRCAYRIVGS